MDEIAIFGAASESFSKYVIYAIKMIKFYAVFTLREIVEGTICDSFRGMLCGFFQQDKAQYC